MQQWIKMTRRKILESLNQFIINRFKKYLFLIITDTIASILIIPCALLTGWLIFGLNIEINHVHHLNDAQKILTYIISGLIFLSVSYFFIQLPFSMWFKIKAIFSDEPKKNIYIKWRWYLGNDYHEESKDFSKTKIIISYMIHVILLYLIRYGLIAIFAFGVFFIVSGYWSVVGSFSSDLSFVLIVSMEIAKMIA